jgi:MYXO-CTERM domain-containing protein
MYLVVSAAGGGQLLATRIAADGTALDPTPLVVATSAAYGSNLLQSRLSGAAVAAIGTTFEVVWTENRCDSPDPGEVGCSPDQPGIYGRQVAADGTISAEKTITTVGDYRDPPSDASIVSNGTEFAVTWSYPTVYEGFDRYKLFALLDASGTPQFQGVLTVTGISGTGGAAAARIASNGDDFLAVWGDGSMLRAARIAPNGTIPASDVNGFPLVAAPGADFAVASNGTDYLVIQRDHNGSRALTAERVSDAPGAVYPDDVGGFTVATQTGASPIVVVGAPGIPYLAAYQDATFTETAYQLIASDSSACGNGVVDPTETCDDGDTDMGDGCSSTCGTEHGYQCTGNPSVCSDLDECATNNGGCAQTCTNSTGSFACSCNPGYELAGDSHSCNDIDECATGTSGCAQTCTNSIGSFACSCQSGYTLDADGHSCNDIDECAVNNGGCEQVCANTPGSYACGCNAGYARAADGHSCDDIDECATGNGGCAQTCTNAVGSYACSCGTGYTLATDGHGCDIDACLTANGGCAQTCTNMHGSATCSCESGFELSGDLHTCNDIDECSTGTDTCSDHAACLNTYGSFSCICNSGYEGDGETCEPHSGGCAASSPGSWGLVVLVFGLVPVRRRRRR